MAQECKIQESTNKGTLATNVAADLNDANAWAIRGYAKAYNGTDIVYSCFLERTAASGEEFVGDRWPRSGREIPLLLGNNPDRFERLMRLFEMFARLV